MRIKGFFDIAITDVFINEKYVSDVLYADCTASIEHSLKERILTTTLTNQYLEMFIYFE